MDSSVKIRDSEVGSVDGAGSEGGKYRLVYIMGYAYRAGLGTLGACAM